MIPETEKTQEAKGVYPGNLRGKLRLIRVDTLRGVHNVGFSRGMAQFYFMKHPYHL